MKFILFNKELYYKEGNIYNKDIMIGKVLPYLNSLVEEHIMLIARLKYSYLYPTLNIDKEKEVLTNYILWINKFYYKYDRNSGNYVNSCPIDNSYRIGSANCQKCRNNLGYNSDKSWIMCSIINDNNK